MSTPFSLRAELKGVEVAPGVTLRYWAAGAGRVLVMLSGLGHAASLYKYQLEGLCDEFRVIALDLRGHGESDKPERGYNYHTLAKDRTRPQRRDDPRPLRWLQDHCDLLRALR